MAKNKGNLEKTRRNKALMAVGIALFIAGVFTFSFLTRNENPNAAPEELKEMILSNETPGKTASDMAKEGLNALVFRKPDNFSDEQMKNISGQMEKLTPGARKKLIKEIVMVKMEKVKKQISKMSRAEKEELLETVLEKIRDRFNDMSPKEREKMKSMVTSEGGRDEMREALNTYYNDFSSEDRQAMDPVMREVFNNLNNL
jgi:hypothetical protein